MKYRKHLAVLFHLLSVALIGCSGSDTTALPTPDGGGSAGTPPAGGAGNAGRTGSGGANGARPDAAGTSLEPNVCGGRGFFPLPVESTSSECPACGPPPLIEGGMETCPREGLVCVYRDMPRTLVAQLWARCTCIRVGDSGSKLEWGCRL